MYDLARLIHHNNCSILAVTCFLAAAPMACGPTVRPTQPSITAGTEPAPESPALAIAEPSPSGHASLQTAGPTSEGKISKDKPVAIVNGRRVTWVHLQPLLAEASGGMILEEHILQNQLNEELIEAKITLSSDATDKEQELLLISLNEDPDMALRLLKQIRLRQGLGDLRYQNLLWRNAALRALVQKDVDLQDDAVARLHDVMYGAKRTGRIAVFSDLVDAQNAKERAEGGEPFIDIVVESSIADSANNGGKFGPMSRADPEFPMALRETLWSMELGQYSAPVLFQERYAIIELLNETPAEPITLEQAQPDLQRVLRMTQERLLMSQLARRLVDGADITIFDVPLQQSHQQYERRESP